MSRGSWRVKPTEITRAVKAVQAAGLPIRNVLITEAGVNINVAEQSPDPQDGVDAPENIRELL